VVRYLFSFLVMELLSNYTAHFGIVRFRNKTLLVGGQEVTVWNYLFDGGRDVPIGRHGLP